MGGTATNKTKKTKKRWRIGGIRGNKPVPTKEIAIDDDDLTETATPESSSASLDVGSNGSLEEINDTNPFNDLPPTMSEVEDDSDSDDDDLYLENSNDMKGIEKFSNFSKAPQPRNAENEDEQFNNNGGRDQQVNADERADSDNGSHSSFEEDMVRHQIDRRNSPHFSRELAKIAEDSDDFFNTPSNPVNPFEDDFEAAYNDDELPPPPPPPPPLPQMKEAIPVSPTQLVFKELKGLEEDCNEQEVSINLPNHKEISKTLCKIVATEHYSGRESLLALEKLSKWAHTQDTNLLKHLLTYGGVVKVIDFLDEQIDNVSLMKSRSGFEFLMEAIHKAADVLCNVCFVGKHGINEDIAIVNATVVVKYGGIETLLQASDVYIRSDFKNDPLALKAAEGVWNAIMNVYCNAEAAVTREISMLVLDAAIDLMSAIGSVDHVIATETLANVFNSLYRITYHDFITQEDFQQKDLLNQVLNVFKRDVTSSDGDEELLEEVMSFLYGCHEKCLFNGSSDYESVLPLCVMGLREFAQENENIREWASKLLDGACSNIENKSSIMMAEGAIEVIAPFLTYEDVGPADKEFMRNLIRKIVSPVY